MIIVLKQNAPEVQVREFCHELQDMGLQINDSKGSESHILGLIGDTKAVAESWVLANPVVETCRRVTEPYKKANRKFHPDDSVIDVDGVKIGGGNFAVIAGPCSIESEEQITYCAQRVKAAGASLLRGGAFKPRTSPYSFQGMRSEGLDLLKLARRATGAPIVTEIMNTEHLPLFENVDLIQVGARNMQNFELLKAVGRQKKPVLLKRGLANTLEEFVMSAQQPCCQRVAALVEGDGHQRHQRADEIIDALRGHSIFLPFFSIPYIILFFEVLDKGVLLLPPLTRSPCSPFCHLRDICSSLCHLW